MVIDSLVNEMVLTAEERLFAEDSLSAEVRRELLTLLRILPEVERNGDLAEHIARRAAPGSAPRCPHEAVVCRADGRSRLHDLARGDRRHHRWKTEAVGAIEDIDDELDDLHVSLTAELTSGSMTLPVAVELALLARFYERFGDHCVNLARRQVGRDGAD